MSVAVAVRKGNEVVLAADSQTNFGHARVSQVNHRADKIREVGPSLMAATGWGLYDNILDDILAKNTPRLTNRQSIFAFFLKLWKALHEKYPYVCDQVGEDGDSPFGDLDASFLIVNGNGIFYVAGDLSVTEFKEYYAIGAGSDFSMGALHALYGTECDAAESARRAVAAAIEFSLYCGGEIQVCRKRLSAGRKARASA